MVLLQLFDPLPVISIEIPVPRKSFFNLKFVYSVKASQVVAKGVVEGPPVRYVWSYVKKYVVAREEDFSIWLIQAKMPWRMPGVMKQFLPSVSLLT
jgi:hypothetical protein